MQYHLKDISVSVFLGAEAKERETPQVIKVSIEFSAESAGAAISDSLADAFDYAPLEHAVRTKFSQKQYYLLEHLHADILKNFRENFPQMQNTQVTITKFPFASGSISVC